jgi:hypothetical protein
VLLVEELEAARVVLRVGDLVVEVVRLEIPVHALQLDDERLLVTAPSAWT